jgi:hypothetical protein
MIANLDNLFNILFAFQYIFFCFNFYSKNTKVNGIIFLCRQMYSLYQNISVLYKDARFKHKIKFIGSR